MDRPTSRPAQQLAGQNARTAEMSRWTDVRRATGGLGFAPMTAAAIRARAPSALLPGTLLLGALLVVAVAIRVGTLVVPGHLGDVSVVAGWAERLAAVGPHRFYSESGSVYPALLYLYGPLGVLFDGAALELAIKALSIPFDVAIGCLLYALVSPRAGTAAGVGAAALYLLNPAVILAGPVWGQIDAAGALAMLVALAVAANGGLASAAAVATIAGLVKPQYGLVLVPVLTLAVLEWRRSRRRAPLLRALAGATVGYAVVCAPLLLDPLTYLSNVVGVTGIRTEASVLAPNPWALLLGYDTPDGGYAWLGLGLLLAGLLAAELPLLRRRDTATLLAVGAFVVFAFYFLPTRVHERYLFPAMALLAPLAAVSRRVLAAYLVMAAAFTLSLLYALAATTPFPMPPEWSRLLVTPTTVRLLSMVLIGAALTLVILLSGGATRTLGDAAERSPETRDRVG
jgi:Gpi18-like mannosyltransferase